MDAFTRGVGYGQGRIDPTGWTPADGSWCFCLGEDAEDLAYEFDSGDYVEVEQTADFGATTVLAFRGRIRGPYYGPPGHAWDFAIRIDAADRAVRRIEPGRTIDLADMIISVADLAPGNHSLAFRLTLVVAP